MSRQAAIFVAVMAATACSLTTSLDGFSSGGPEPTPAADAFEDVAPPKADGSPALDGGADVDAAPRKIVFASSTTYTGNLGGLGGADAKCQSLAVAALLSGQFRAWLSDDTSAATARLSHASIPYARVDGVVVAKDWSGLTSGALLAPIDKTETGGAALGGDDGGCASEAVWTNTAGDGTKHGSLHCLNWTSIDPAARATSGDAVKKNGEWTDACDRPCLLRTLLYCVEQ